MGSVEDFLNADFIIPESGGSMAAGFTGSKEEADRLVQKFSDAAKKDVDVLQEAFWCDGGWADQIYEFLKRHSEFRYFTMLIAPEETGPVWQLTLKKPEED